MLQKCLNLLIFSKLSLAGSVEVSNSSLLNSTIEIYIELSISMVLNLLFFLISLKNGLNTLCFELFEWINLFVTIFHKCLNGTTSKVIYLRYFLHIFPDLDKLLHIWQIFFLFVLFFISRVVSNGPLQSSCNLSEAIDWLTSI